MYCCYLLNLQRGVYRYILLWNIFSINNVNNKRKVYTVIIVYLFSVFFGFQFDRELEGELDVIRQKVLNCEDFSDHYQCHFKRKIYSPMIRITTEQIVYFICYHFHKSICVVINE